MQHQHQRVLADGWGQQTTGSVFCADSSLRYIYESHPTSPTLSPPQLQSGYGSDRPLLGGVYPRTSKLTNSNVTVEKRSQDGDSWHENKTRESVDWVEVEIARACRAIRNQTASLPPSFRECAVCLCTNALAQIRGCGHTFHPHCFLRWFRRNRSCPLCRGAVKTIEVAQPVVVQDELEAIMAEIDQDAMPLMAPEPLERSEANVLDLDDPSLLTPSDELLSFLDDEFDADMELGALEELNATAPGGWELELKQESRQVATEKGGDELATDAAWTPSLASSSFHLSHLPQQFPPVSAVPNYWNVLNEGLAPSTIPPSPARQAPRMVHIAPRPDVPTMQRDLTDTVAMTDVTWSVPFSHPPQPTHPRASSLPSARAVSCRCTSGCRNGRCACVKEGGMCDTSCRCTSCKNPFLMVKAAGADIEALLHDACFMQNVAKTRDMVQRLEEQVTVACCDRRLKVVDCVQGHECKSCHRRYDFSWCMNKLVDTERTPRNHCTICKRCCDHRDVHCHDCNRCYFAGVTASLPCPCKEASRRKKRREVAVTRETEDEGEGECSIM
ncbi:hypothetical protein PsorP6_015032 [Peronosclerospora sorghi]|uniref:Uncharacterized protein n=1 Tax=Peronosclerospora sorghi TaxID=230839 RepID=A0ACC0VSL0_9STRA|nr:hypothetical protein PsorP6_015032 [Peronosclerospora sorghi]